MAPGAVQMAGGVGIDPITANARPDTHPTWPGERTDADVKGCRELTSGLP